MYRVKVCIVCVIYIKGMEVLDISVKVGCMSDEYEDSYECIFRMAEISCMFLYCI